MAENILLGEYDRPLNVVALSLAEGWAGDVSEDIAGMVVERTRSEQRSLVEGSAGL